MHYMGEYQGGLRHGFGVWQGGACSERYVYSGSWERGLMSGQGRFAWKVAGHFFEGLFHHGCPTQGAAKISIYRKLCHLRVHAYDIRLGFPVSTVASKTVGTLDTRAYQGSR